MATVGSKSLTSQAKRTGASRSGKIVMGAPPLLPATTLSHVSSRVLPTGVTIPMPVKTTRRPPSSRKATLQPQSAVDGEHRSGHEPGCVRHEEAYAASDVLGFTKPPERRARRAGHTTRAA